MLRLFSQGDNEENKHFPLLPPRSGGPCRPRSLVLSSQRALGCRRSPGWQWRLRPAPPRSLVPGPRPTASGDPGLLPQLRPRPVRGVCPPRCPHPSTCPDRPDLRSAQTSGLVDLSTRTSPKKASHCKIEPFVSSTLFWSRERHHSLAWAVSLGSAAISPWRPHPSQVGLVPKHVQARGHRRILTGSIIKHRMSCRHDS